MREKEGEYGLLIRHFRDLAHAAERKHTVTHTNFLNLAEQSLFYEQTDSFREIPYRVTGGWPEAERRIVLFGEEADREPDPIVIVQIARKNVRFTDAPTHRDYLGALLHLGVKREMVGDILPEETGNGACVFCMAGICDFLLENLTAVRQDRVICRTLPELPDGYTCKKRSETVTVASERLDAVAAAVWHLSRGQSCGYFSAGKAFSDGRCITDGSARPRPGSIISLRGLGRFQYVGIVGDTKKGRCRIEIKRYL